MSPTPRYTDWRPVAIHKWATAWIGLLVSAAAFVMLSLLTRQFNFGFFVLAGVLGRLVNAWLVERQMAPLRDGAQSGQHAAILRLSRETTYAFDEGLVSFEGPWLVYTGRRCTFSVRSSDVRFRTVDRTNLGFRFGPAEDERTASLTFKAHDALQRQASDWRACRDENEGRAVFPPLVPNETAWNFLRSLSAAGLFGAGLLVAFGLFHRTFPTLLLIAACLSMGAPGVTLYVTQSRKALRRIASSEPRRPLLWNRPLFGLMSSLLALPEATPEEKKSKA